MVRRLTGGRGGGRGKEKTPTRNGGVEEARSFKENDPILYFPRNGYLLLISHPLAQKSMTSCHAFLLIVKLGDRTSPSFLTRTIPSDPIKAHSDP